MAMPDSDFSFRHQRRLSSVRSGVIMSSVMRRGACGMRVDHWRVDCAFRAFPAARQAARQCQWCWWRFRSAIYIRFRVRYQSLGLIRATKRYSAKLLLLVVFRGEQPSRAAMRAAQAQYRRNGSTSSVQTSPHVTSP